MRSVKILIALSVGLCHTGLSQTLPYKNPKLSTDQRVVDLLSRMTVEEKFWQLFMIPASMDVLNNAEDKINYKNGIFGFQVSAAAQGIDDTQQLLKYSAAENGLALASKINAIQKYFIEQTKLGIPIIAFDEALHGLVRNGATSFPQSIALAATFDTLLMSQVAAAIAEETKARGIRQILSPVINIASDVRWGRVEETYGEDPFLTSEMGVAFVSAFEKRNVITTPKHFIANVGDGGRDSYPIHFNERFLEEVHFPPFKACIERGGTRSVMTCYNSLDGVPCSANEWLLTKKLKQEWNFSGFVISDASAVGGSIVLHYTAADFPTSGAQAINSGLDVIFQTQYKHHELFLPSFLDGRIDKQKLDEAVSRVLKAKFELGLFENPYVSEELVKKISIDKHKALAKEAALKSIVLLKNTRVDAQENILPLSKKIRSIAVIGTDAAEGRLGGYSGPGNGVVTILDGIKQRAGKTEVNYAPGCGRNNEEWKVVPADYLTTEKNAPGLTGQYFNNVDLSGNPVISRIDKEINFHWTLNRPDPAINKSFYSIRWTGYISSPLSGNYKIGLDGNDGFRLYINDRLVIDQWRKQTYSTSLADFQFEKGKSYSIRVEFTEPTGNAHLKLIWNVGVKEDWKQKIDEAVAAAKKSDVAIVVAGITEGEFQDRAMLSLPGHQEELIKKIAATGKPIVVILVGGSAVTMNDWINDVQGILDVWYPGEEGGHALAEILFGDANPAGRLPITFPLHEAQLPLVYNHKPTGRGDDYNNLSGLPLFPFGFGLSYADFSYENARLDKATIRKNESAVLRFEITNSGKIAGEEVIQLYVKDLLSSVARPVLELKGFQRVLLQPGEKKVITFSITPDMLSMLNKDMKKVVEPGKFHLLIGTSSRDIRLRSELIVTE